MLKSVTLTNFRGFGRLQLDLKRVAVVVGPNSSGKTSILHAISAAHKAYALALTAADAHPTLKEERILVCEGTILHDHVRLLPSSVADEIFRDAAVAEGVQTEIVLAFEESDRIHQIMVRLVYGRNRVLKLTVEVVSPSISDQVRNLPSKSKKVSSTLLELLRMDPPVAVLVPAFYGVTLHEEYHTAPVVNEQLQEGQQSRIVRNLIARLTATDRVQLDSFLKRTVGASIVYATSAANSETEHPLQVRFRDNNGPLDLSSAGAGVVNLIALFAALKWRQATGSGTTVFLLDEPEAHLHPRLQGKLGDELASLVHTFGKAQLIAATHSIEMINQLGLRDDTVLFSVDRSRDTVAQLDSQRTIISALSEWADMTPFTSLNFLASQRLLFHEGPTDEAILSAAAEVLFQNNPDSLAKFRRWTLVALDGVGKAPGVAALRQVLQPRVFPDLSNKPVHVVLVLDRDRTRAPTFDVSTESNLSSTSVVWSKNSIESLFLEPNILSEWIAAALPLGSTATSVLRVHVQNAIAAVDQMVELNEHAVADLAPTLQSQYPKESDRIKAAQQQIREAPSTWQKGRERAKRILEQVRKSLPTKEQTHVRASIADLLKHANIDRLSNPNAAVPDEVKKLLEHLQA